MKLKPTTMFHFWIPLAIFKVNVQAREIRKAIFVDILLKRMAGTENLIVDKPVNPLLSPLIIYQSAVNYFCETSPLSNEEGGDQAIANLDKYYRENTLKMLPVYYQMPVTFIIAF